VAANNSIEPKTQTLPNGYKVSYRNDCELQVIYNDVFNRNTYFFKTDNPEPRIVDCGGHIGLAVLYFKSLYPKSTIVTFEPNPETFALLTKNIAQNNLHGVEANNIALSCEDNDDATFYVGKNFLEAWDSTDTIKPDLWVNMNRYRRISARSARLSSYIANGVDFLKLDIEGAEYDVLGESRDKIGSVGAITLEYHQNAHNLAEGKLEKTLEILSSAGFEYELYYQSHPVSLHSLPSDEVYQLIVRATQ
jgi:FkbM family methyltransferase